MSFIKTNFRFLLFGVALGFFASFGQTYFIGVYRLEIMQAFSLSNSDFGLMYFFCDARQCTRLESLWPFNRSNAS